MALPWVIQQIKDLLAKFPVSIANGGTGANTAAAARNALGLGNTTGPVPIANGGTGATTAAAARSALGIVSGAPVPKAAAGVGQWTKANVSGTNIVAPSGGTWAVFRTNIVNGTPYAAIVAGGGVIALYDGLSSAAISVSLQTLCWRIA